MLPSNECSILPKLSELSISHGSDFGLSGLAISFGKTLPYLPHKTVTRRIWKDSHAQKFINAFHNNKLVKAFDKEIRYQGQHIGWCRLLCAPYKEQLSAMPNADLLAEGGMCSSVESFIHQYFKGNGSLQVWVIRFEFIAAEILGVYLASDIANNDNYPPSSLTSKYTPNLTLNQHDIDLDIHPNNGDQVDSNTTVISPLNTLHQSSIDSLGVYSDNANQSDSNYSITLTAESVHQESVVQGGSGLVYSFWKGESMVNHYRYKVKVNGKWKVRSIYIPVGKLPKVREAITNQLGVIAIVIGILGKRLEA